MWMSTGTLLVNRTVRTTSSAAPGHRLEIGVEARRSSGTTTCGPVLRRRLWLDLCGAEETLVAYGVIISENEMTRLLVRTSMRTRFFFFKNFREVTPGHCAIGINSNWRGTVVKAIGAPVLSPPLTQSSLPKPPIRLTTLNVFRRDGLSLSLGSRGTCACKGPQSNMMNIATNVMGNYRTLRF